jgi:hypothetical protein
MNQHIPQVTREDILKVIHRDFPDVEDKSVLSILSKYGELDFHQEVNRVRMDILKLSGGDTQRLKIETETACCDFRDTILMAEYPNYAKKIHSFGSLTPAIRKQINKEDHLQYTSWLCKKTASG